MAVTSSDVARRAGVSQATVSYVLNATPGQAISERTRALVLKAADDLGYQPSSVARGLRRGRTDAVVCPLPGLTLTYTLACLVETCAAALEREGLFLVPDFTPRNGALAQVAAWRRLAPTAVLDILLPRNDPALRELKRTRTPVLSANLPDQPAWETAGDIFARSERLTQLTYLAGKGHRSVLVLLPPSLGTDIRAERRLLGDMRRMARSDGFALRVQRIDLDTRKLGRVARDWVRAGALPDAIAAYNDEYAIAVISALQAHDVVVPRDVAVMGLDDIPIGRVFTPALTTITPEFGDFADALAQAVKALADGKQDSPALPVPGHSVIARESA
jgi:DNA-binding LacI/PurR family transcriptional regulator